MARRLCDNLSVCRSNKSAKPNKLQNAISEEVRQS